MSYLTRSPQGATEPTEITSECFAMYSRVSVVPYESEYVLPADATKTRPFPLRPMLQISDIFVSMGSNGYDFSIERLIISAFLS